MRSNYKTSIAILLLGACFFLVVFGWVYYKRELRVRNIRELGEKCSQVEISGNVPASTSSGEHAWTSIEIVVTNRSKISEIATLFELAVRNGTAQKWNPTDQVSTKSFLMFRFTTGESVLGETQILGTSTFFYDENNYVESEAIFYKASQILGF